METLKYRKGEDRTKDLYNLCPPGTKGRRIRIEPGDHLYQQGGGPADGPAAASARGWGAVDLSGCEDIEWEGPEDARLVTIPQNYPHDAHLFASRPKRPPKRVTFGGFSIEGSYGAPGFDQTDKHGKRVEQMHAFNLPGVEGLTVDGVRTQRMGGDTGKLLGAVGFRIRNTYCDGNRRSDWTVQRGSRDGRLENGLSLNIRDQAIDFEATGDASGTPPEDIWIVDWVGPYMTLFGLSGEKPAKGIHVIGGAWERIYGGDLIDSEIVTRVTTLPNSPPIRRKGQPSVFWRGRMRNVVLVLEIEGLPGVMALKIEHQGEWNNEDPRAAVRTILQDSCIVGDVQLIETRETGIYRVKISGDLSINNTFADPAGPIRLAGTTIEGRLSVAGSKPCRVEDGGGNKIMGAIDVRAPGSKVVGADVPVPVVRAIPPLPAPPPALGPPVPEPIPVPEPPAPIPEPPPIPPTPEPTPEPPSPVPELIPESAPESARPYTAEDIARIRDLANRMEAGLQ